MFKITQQVTATLMPHFTRFDHINNQVNDHNEFKEDVLRLFINRRSLLEVLRSEGLLAPNPRYWMQYTTSSVHSGCLHQIPDIGCSILLTQVRRSACTKSLILHAVYYLLGLEGFLHQIPDAAYYFGRTACPKSPILGEVYYILKSEEVPAPNP